MLTYFACPITSDLTTSVIFFVAISQFVFRGVAHKSLCFYARQLTYVATLVQLMVGAKRSKRGNGKVNQRTI